MVETFGGNRGITPSISKRVKRGYIRYNLNDSPTSYIKKAEREHGNYEGIARAKLADIEHYLGDDWIDWDCVYIPTTSIENYRKNRMISTVKERSTSEVFRCSSCGEAYQTKTMDYNTRIIGNSILPKSIYTRIPLHRGECGLCG